MDFLRTDDLTDGEIRLVLEKTTEGDEEKGWVPAYHFAICGMDGTSMGSCDLRIGHNENLWYGGNIGYRVEEAYRGHHYASKACKLLFLLAARHGLGYVIITCSPDNAASYRTCLHAGASLITIAELPEGNDMRREGVAYKCIFRKEV